MRESKARARRNGLLLAAVFLPLAVGGTISWTQLSETAAMERASRRLLESRLTQLATSSQVIAAARQRRDPESKATIGDTRELMLELSESSRRGIHVSSLVPGPRECWWGQEYEVVQAILAGRPDQVATELERLHGQSIVVLSLRIQPTADEMIRAEASLGVASAGE